MDYKQYDSSMKDAIKKIDHLIVKFDNKFPSPETLNYKYKDINNVEWTTSFLNGLSWLAYQVTKEEKYKEFGLIKMESFIDRLVNNKYVDHHDLGFLYSLSCVSTYKLTGNREAKETAIHAADRLLMRFVENGEFLQAWGNAGDKEENRLIIDSLMNLPLLYWATEITGDVKYKDIADKHYTTTLKNVIREDDSTYHTFYFDLETGKPINGITRQGYSDDSSWARGQAWAIYGIALSFRHNKTEENIQQFMRVTNYFLDHLPSDDIPYWDLIFTEKDKMPRDSSAAAIAICGILEAVEHLPTSSLVKEYEKKAMKMLKSLCDSYTYTNITEETDCILTDTVYSWHDNIGIDEGSIWGDYFFMEALTRLNKNWISLW